MAEPDREKTTEERIAEARRQRQKTEAIGPALVARAEQFHHEVLAFAASLGQWIAEQDAGGAQ